MTALLDDEFHAIESALGSTARGRSFLAEVGRRQRAAETERLMDAIGKLERVVREDRRGIETQRIRDDLRDMSGAIERTRAEIASIRPSVGEQGQIEEATEELDATVRAAETATNDILAAAERVQESLDALREGGGDPALCEVIDTAVIEIFTACSFQDITGQRTRKVVQLLRYLEARVAAMIEIWSGENTPEDAAPGPAEALAATLHPTGPVDTRPDAHLLHGPAREGEGITQATVDTMFGAAAEEMDGDDPDWGNVESLPTRLAVESATPAAAEVPVSGSVVELMQRLEAMTPGERLALFS